MAEERIATIKGKLAQGLSALSLAEVEWLVTRLEELEKENEFLRKELSYSEHQGEVGY
jgi:cell shape-determining protein MreC